MTEQQLSGITPKKTILVVDDDLMSLEMLLKILSFDYNVVQAQSGAEALHLLTSMKPDIIMADVIMPEMNGYEMYRRIKLLPGMEDVPLIFLTCMSEFECESEGLELGAVDYITKPYNPQLVRLRVRNHLLLKARIDELSLDVTRRKQAEAKLRCITDSANDAILMMDPDGNISYWNKAAEEILGYSAAEVLGKNLHRLLAPERYHAAHLSAFPLFLQTGQGNAVGKRVELSAIRKDGQEIDVSVSLSGVMLNGQWHAVGIIRDITELKRYQYELEKARDAADAANRAKSEFLANMSHEIRTPMNGVIGMSQLLRFTELTEEQEEYLDSIEVSADSLLQLINDILDLSKIESGKVELEFADFSLRKAIEDVLMTQQSHIFRKKLNLQKELVAGLPEVLKGDQLRVKQILLNLISNAVKFTEQGSITIVAKLLEQRAGSVLVRLTVTDTGIGITPEALEKIFNPFEQADNSVTRRFGGTGLGLSICRRLAELMGGVISVESIPGKGSSFHLDLPFERSSAYLKQLAESRCLPKVERQLMVLVVEDVPMNQRMVEMALQRIGHSAICVNNGQEALERWRKGGVDLILMDIQMPVMDGIEAVAIIRAEEQQSGGHIPVVALTANALTGTSEKLLRSGFDGFMSKPLKVKLLAEELERLTAVG